MEVAGERLRCRRCGEALHGVAYVAEMWATLWGIWQHCDPPPTEGTMLDHYVEQLGKMQDAAGDCIKGRGDADRRGFGEIESIGYGGEPDDPDEIAVNPELMPPPPWEKQRR